METKKLKTKKTTMYSGREIEVNSRLTVTHQSLHTFFVLQDKWGPTQDTSRPPTARQKEVVRHLLRDGGLARRLHSFDDDDDDDGHHSDHHHPRAHSPLPPLRAGEQGGVVVVASIRRLTHIHFFS